MVASVLGVSENELKGLRLVGWLVAKLIYLTCRHDVDFQMIHKYLYL